MPQPTAACRLGFSAAGPSPQRCLLAQLLPCCCLCCAANLNSAVRAAVKKLEAAVKPVLLVGANMRSARARAAIQASPLLGSPVGVHRAWAAGPMHGCSGLAGNLWRCPARCLAALSLRVWNWRAPPPAGCQALLGWRLSVWAVGWSWVQALAEASSMPVAVMPNAKGLFPETHPNFIGERVKHCGWMGRVAAWRVEMWVCRAHAVFPPHCGSFSQIHRPPCLSTPNPPHCPHSHSHVCPAGVYWENVSTPFTGEVVVAADAYLIAAPVRGSVRCCIIDVKQIDLDC